MPIKRPDWYQYDGKGNVKPEHGDFPVVPKIWEIIKTGDIKVPAEDDGEDDVAD